MDGSVIKGLELNHSDADILKSSSSIVSRIYVEGYDTSPSGHDFVMSMRKHFASCGEVLHVYIPGYAERRTLNRFALVYLRGEGAEEKALTLSGSYSRGHTLVVEPYPFHAKHLDHELAPTRDADNKQEHMISVEGYDTSLPLKYAEGMLFQELSKHGRILEVSLFKDEENEAVLSRDGAVFVKGIDTVEKLLQLCGCDVKGMENVKVTRVAAPEQDGASACDMPPWFFEYSSSRTTTEVMAATAPEDPNLPKPPCKSTLLPYPWRSRVDSGTGYMCIWNTETGDIMYEGPPFSSKPASTIRYAREDPTLPKPWKGLVDNGSGYLYFWNTETNVTQYQRPPSN